MDGLGRVVADAWAGRDEGRLGVNLVIHQASDRDCRSAKVHDFQWALAEREHRV
jgi:hypothetical protein